MKTMILKSLKCFYRSPANIFMTVVFPLVMIFFLGSFLQNLDISDHEIGEINLAYGIKNSDGYSDIAFNSFMENSGEAGFQKAENPDLAKEQIAAGELDAYIELDGKNIRIYSGNNAVKARAVKMVMQSFLTMSETYYSIYEINPSGITQAANFEYKSYTEQNGLGISRSMMDYYAIAMIVMMSFMCFITSGAMDVKDEELYKTISRIYISTRSKTLVYLSTVISHAAMAAVSVLIAMLFSVYVFGAKYCDSFSGNLLLYFMLFCVNLAVVGVGIVVGIVSKISPISFIIPVSWSMLFFSGSFSKEIFIDGFSQYLPPYLIQQAAFDLTLFSNGEKAAAVTLVSLAVFAATAVLGAVLYNRKKVV